NNTNNTNTTNNTNNTNNNNISAVSAWNTATNSVIQQQRHCAKRSREDSQSTGYETDSTTSSLGDTSNLQCPRLQTQPLCLARKRSQSLGTTMQGCGSVAQLDPSTVKANFVDCLVGEYT
ncbi:hypothetical protein BGZ76_005176, partial [Entomortierella beljakovae]